LYERRCPNETMQQQAELIQCLSEHNHYFALISREASWLNWLALLDSNIQLLQQGHFLVLGERLAQILKQYQQQMHVPFKMSVLKDLKTATIVQLLQSEQGNA
jgi:uroporphyrinogen-III synthase